MIHCTTEDLLALKGGEGTAWARRHLNECDECRRQMDALHQRIARLRALPSLNPPRDRWPVIRQELVRQKRGRVLALTRWGSLAAAAALMIVIGSRTLQRQDRDVAQGADIAALVSQSQQLEAALEDFAPESRVQSGAVAGAVAELEDRIAAIDAQLGDATQDRVENLWRRRVELMQGLVSVHATRATYSGM